MAAGKWGAGRTTLHNYSPRKDSFLSTGVGQRKSWFTPSELGLCAPCTRVLVKLLGTRGQLHPCHGSASGSPQVSQTRSDIREDIALSFSKGQNITSSKEKGTRVWFCVSPWKRWLCICTLCSEPPANAAFTLLALLTEDPFWSACLWQGAALILVLRFHDILTDYSPR